MSQGVICHDELKCAMFKIIKDWFKKKEDRLKLENWYFITWDEEYIYRNVSPPGKKPWSDSFKWNDIIRICFNATAPLYPDEYIFFTSERPESYLIPSEANGAFELWNVVLEKELFDSDLAIKAATSINGLFCWPSEDR